MRAWLMVLGSVCGLCESVRADAPVASYIFPAGGQRGSTVNVRVGGLNLYEKCAWEMQGPGVTASKHLSRMKTLWFEGPRLPLPDSQRQEDYPQDMHGEVAIAKDAAAGVRRGRVWTSEGAAGGLAFMVGDLPEVVEEEAAGDPIAVPVKLPVTVNGRIYPREDIDVWSFVARKGQAISCEVHAQRVGSPLDSRLEVRGPDGKLVAENDDARGTDSYLRFIAPSDGTYHVRIHDSQRGGSQRHVYRLTISDGPYVGEIYPLGGRKGMKTRFMMTGTNVPQECEVSLDDAVGVRLHTIRVEGKATNAVPLDVDAVTEYHEANDVVAETPCVLNGRVERAGEVDTWRFTARKGQVLRFAMRSVSLGSPLAGVAEIVDDAGKSLFTSEPRFEDFRFTAPREDTYSLRLRDQFRSRGGPTFVYRLRIGEPQPDFALEPIASAIGVLRGQRAVLRVKVNRIDGFAAPITVTAKGLPAGVKAAAVTAKPGQPHVDLAFVAEKDAPLTVHRIQIVGTAAVEGKTIEHLALMETLPGERAEDDVLLAVALKAPFEVVGTYDLRLAARGSVFRKKYTIRRNGFTGPLEVRLADKQARHLQGVTGPTIPVASDVSEFEYPVTLPPWMETGRTSRACVMAVGKVVVDGVEHVVSFTSQAQNDQLIAVVETGQLSLELGRSSIVAKAGEAVAIPISIRRGKGLTGAVKVELVLPGHVRGVSAEPAVLSESKTTGTLTLRCTDKVTHAMPLVIRATLTSSSGPVTAEATLELVGP